MFNSARIYIHIHYIHSAYLLEGLPCLLHVLEALVRVHERGQLAVAHLHVVLRGVWFVVDGIYRSTC